MKKYKQLCLICFALSLLLAGCGKEKNIPAEDKGKAQTASDTDYGYYYQKSPLPGEMALTVTQFAAGSDIYLCGMDKHNAPLVYRYDGESVLDYALPDEIEYAAACCLTEGGLTVLAGDRPAYWYNAQNYPQNNDRSFYALYLLTYDLEGQLVSQIPLPDALCRGAGFYSLRYAEGFYYLLNETDLIQLSADGVIKNTRHFEGGMFVAQVTTGQSYAVEYFHSAVDGGDNTVKIDVLLTPETFEFETVFSEDDQSIYGAGYTDSGELILRADGGLHILAADGKSRTEFYNFAENGIMTTTCHNFYPCTDGYLLDSRNQKSITRVIWGKIFEKTELVLWVKQESEHLTDMVTNFNRTNRQNQVRMESVKDRSVDQLRAQILAGKGPDLYFTGSGNAALELSSDAAFEDLLPYLDSSAVVQRDSFVRSVLEAMLSGGKLYSVPVSMEVYTVLCRDISRAGPDMHLSDMLLLPEVQDGSYHVFTQEYSRDAVWKWLSNMYIAGHVDEAAGTCNFDTEEYTEMLTACKAASVSEPAVDEIPCLLSPEHIVGVRRLMYFQRKYGDRFAFLANYGTALEVWDAFAISNTSENKEAAWQFIEYALSATEELDDGQFLLPTTQGALDELLEDATSVGVWNYTQERYEQLSSYTLEQFAALLQQDAVVMGKYPQLIQIMREEAEKYFAGDRSAEEAAKMTQSRATIYMAEQYK